MKLLVKIAFYALLIGAVTEAGDKNPKKIGKEKYSKYSKEANVLRNARIKTPDEKVASNNEDYIPPKNFKTSSERLFKILKIQNIWQKAQKVLNEAKLKALYHDLKTQDKQEIAYKRVKAQGKDKEGLQEAALRKQLARIVDNYALTVSFPEHQMQPGDEEQINRMFKDKKLNKLWKKIENAGLDQREMKILKEELDHYQLEVDQYYAFVDNRHETREKTPEMENTLGHFPEDDVEVVRHDKKGKSKHNKTALPKSKDEHVEIVRVKHQELKEHLDELTEKIRAKLNEKEFTSEKAIKLWNLVQNGDFTKEEQGFLRSEIHHYEHRLRKLNHLTSELHHKDVKNLKNKVSEFEKKVERTLEDLTSRIVKRTEL